MDNIKKKQIGIYIVIGIVILIILMNPGCKEKINGLLGGATGGSDGTSSCTNTYSNLPPEVQACSQCHSEWNAQEWQCKGTCSTTGQNCSFNDAYPYVTNPYEQPDCSCQAPANTGCQLYNGACTGTCTQGYDCGAVYDTRGEIIDCTCVGEDEVDTCDDTCKKYYGSLSIGYCALKDGMADTCTLATVPGTLIYPGITTADSWCYETSEYRTCCCTAIPN